MQSSVYGVKELRVGRETFGKIYSTGRGWFKKKIQTSRDLKRSRAGNLVDRSHRQMATNRQHAFETQTRPCCHSEYSDSHEQQSGVVLWFFFFRTKLISYKIRIGKSLFYKSSASLFRTFAAIYVFIHSI